MTTLISKRSTLMLLLATVGFLLLPLIAMQFTSEVNWSTADFVIAAVLICVCGVTTLAIKQRVTGREQQFRVMLIGGLIFVAIWVELAVGWFS